MTDSFTTTILGSDWAWGNTWDKWWSGARKKEINYADIHEILPYDFILSVDDKYYNWLPSQESRDRKHTTTYVDVNREQEFLSFYGFTAIPIYTYKTPGHDWDGWVPEHFDEHGELIHNGNVIGLYWKTFGGIECLYYDIDHWPKEAMEKAKKFLIDNNYFSEHRRELRKIYQNPPQENPPHLNLKIWVEAWGPEGQYFKMEPEVGSHQDVQEIDQMYRRLVSQGQVTRYKIHRAPTLQSNPRIDIEDARFTPCSSLKDIGVERRIKVLAEALGPEIISSPRIQNIYASYKKKYEKTAYRTFICKTLKLLKREYSNRKKAAAARKQQRNFSDYDSNPSSVFDIPIKSQKWAKIISLKTAADARKATSELTKSWGSGHRGEKRQLRRIANLAAIRAKIMAQNERLKAATRNEKQTIRKIYQRWVDSHPLPKPNPPEDEEPKFVGMGVNKAGVVSKIYQKGSRYYRENPGACGGTPVGSQIGPKDGSGSGRDFSPEAQKGLSIYASGQFTADDNKRMTDEYKQEHPNEPIMRDGGEKFYSWVAQKYGRMKRNPASPHLQDLSHHKFGRTFEDLSAVEQGHILEILAWERDRMGWRYALNPRVDAEGNVIKNNRGS
jgi:hypothetical protein